jgi:hypothetical protein
MKHEVHTCIYKEYHSVCHLVGIGKGWGSHNADDVRKKLSTLLTLWDEAMLVWRLVRSE